MVFTIVQLILKGQFFFQTNNSEISISALVYNLQTGQNPKLHSMLGQYFLSDSYVVVHLFSKCTAGVHCAAFIAPSMLAEQVYHYIRVAKNILL